MYAHRDRLALALEIPGIQAAVRGQAQVDATMAGQVVGHRWKGLAVEVSGRTHHGHAQVGADAHRDHVLVHHVAHAHAGIEVLGHDVGKAIVHAQLDLDVRVLAQQFPQFAPQHRDDGMVGGGDPHAACWLVGQRAQGCQFRVQLVEHRRQCAEQSCACLGGGDAARRARQQPHAEPRFQRRHRVAQGRTRHAQLRGRASEAARLRHGHESAQVVEVRCRHWCIPCTSLFVFFHLINQSPCT